MKIIRVGVDLAKSVFQVQGLIVAKRSFGARSWAGQNGSGHCWRKSSRAAKLAWKPVVAHITGLGNCRSEASL